LSVATILSYTRAAWLSLVGALGVWIIVKLNIKFKTIIAISIIALIAVLPFQNEIMLKLKKNNEESSTDFKEHVKSMSNVTSDASNLERINRWNCAIRMFKEKPIFGWGPGTYMFEYAPFQFSYERTIISTNAATLGNAHSEYLGRLSESGVLGLLLFVLIIGFTIHKALSIYSKNEDKSVKNLALYTILGLITYYLHSFLNNFLDTDKLASLFWGFTAIIVALDIYHCEKKEDRLQ
jgi:putative inorganic carbon (hco3(-)) transporter